MDVARVVFACVHNAGRSQMAAAWFNLLADPARAVATSAGTQPAVRVHPEVAVVMQEVGVDLSGAEPVLLDVARVQGAACVVTMGCGEACPVVPGVPLLDWPLPDPKGQDVESVRAIRDAIAERVAAFVTERGWGKSGPTGTM